MVGIDILDLERLDTSDSFMKKIAFDEEIEYVLKSPCDSLVRQRLGALFCVKEAVMKALEMGKDSGVSFKDIKLCHKENGKPFIELLAKREKNLMLSFMEKLSRSAFLIHLFMRLQSLL